jgi:hypothetical protein
MSESKIVTEFEPGFGFEFGFELEFGRSSYSSQGESFPITGHHQTPHRGSVFHRGRSYFPHRGSLSLPGETIILPTGGVPPHRGRPSYSPPGESFPTWGDQDTPHRRSSFPPGGITILPTGESFPIGGDHHTPHRGSPSPQGRSSYSPPGESSHLESRNSPKGSHNIFQEGKILYPPGETIILPTVGVPPHRGRS